MFLYDVKDHDGNVAATVRLDPEDLRKYGEHYIQVDQWGIQGARLISTGNVVTGQMLCPDRVLEQSEFYNDFLRPMDTFSSVLRVHLPGTVSRLPRFFFEAQTRRTVRGRRTSLIPGTHAAFAASPPVSPAHCRVAEKDRFCGGSSGSVGDGFSRGRCRRQNSDAESSGLKDPGPKRWVSDSPRNPSRQPPQRSEAASRFDFAIGGYRIWSGLRIWRNDDRSSTGEYPPGRKSKRTRVKVSPNRGSGEHVIGKVNWLCPPGVPPMFSVAIASAGLRPCCAVAVTACDGRFDHLDSSIRVDPSKHPSGSSTEAIRGSC